MEPKAQSKKSPLRERLELVATILGIVVALITIGAAWQRCTDDDPVADYRAAARKELCPTLAAAATNGDFTTYFQAQIGLPIDKAAWAAAMDRVAVDLEEGRRLLADRAPPSALQADWQEALFGWDRFLGEWQAYRAHTERLARLTGFDYPSAEWKGRITGAGTSLGEPLERLLDRDCFTKVPGLPPQQ